MSASTIPFAAELLIAREAAAEAGALLRSRAGAERVRSKARADLVTEVDEASERAIGERIRTAFPGDVIVAEEFSAAAAHGGRTWIIDPLDGTVHYVHSHPFACVSIAFWDAQGPAVGVVYAPFLGELYHAVRGRGAFLNAEPIRVSDVAAADVTADGAFILLADGTVLDRTAGAVLGPAPGPVSDLASDSARVLYRVGDDWPHEPLWWIGNPKGTGLPEPTVDAVGTTATRTARGGARGTW